MKVKLAKTAGFCMGVRRAMEIALSEANKGDGKLFTYGPIIHNQQALDLLRSKGVDVKEDINTHDKGRIIIRAHGITPAERKKIRSSNLTLIDATCPRVAKVHAIIRKYSNKGYTPVIFGDAKHPEVIGLMGYSKGQGIVIRSVEEVEKLPDKKKIILVSQTTQDVDAYRKIIDATKDHYPGAIIFDTICDETYKRQREVRSLASEVDSMVIVGGYNSGNTKRLYQLSQSTGKPAFHIETEKELQNSWFSSTEAAGVTAGASTPNWMIKSVTDRLKTMGKIRQHPLRSIFKKVFQFLVKITLPEAIGAFFLTYAGLILSRGNADFIHPFLALLYVFSMHVLNRFLDKEASTYNDPGTARFYTQHKNFLITISLIGICAGLILSLALGIAQFLLFLALAILGLAYSIPIIPWRFGYLGRYGKIKDLPGSKSIAEALAWGTISSLLPIIGWPKPFWPGVLVSFFFVSSMCYIRSGLFDILNIQGDLIVGKETLPVALGEERALKLLLLLNSLFGIFILLSTAIGMVSNLGYFFIVCFMISFFYLEAYYKGWMRDGHLLQSIAEVNLLLAGVFAFIWELL
ncbi:MAG TPA: 4-hydroxy-3-methylbut-2-enyl diphosphate reductase [Desulfatiglandales bacterium]|nr:4-hydroxy-3-methylbut-2-enyl diphosphate reductase [Desulfatiglandales bacterium]